MEELSVAAEPEGYPASRMYSHLPMSQRVYLTLRDMLMVGRFSPGESLSLRTLARRLGTSPMPVREAFNRLIAEHALEILPNRQVIVPRMSRQKFQELWKVRQMLEGMAAQAACRNMDAKVAKELEALHEVAMAAIHHVDPSAILSANKDFHFCLYQSSRSEVLLPMIEALWMQMGPFMRVSLFAKRTRWDGAQHVAILDALKQGDARGVSAAVKRDVSEAAKILIEINAFDTDVLPGSAPDTNKRRREPRAEGRATGRSRGAGAGKLHKPGGDNHAENQ